MNDLRRKGIVPFPKCPSCGRSVSGLMRTTAGHYLLLHHGSSGDWRCSVTPLQYAVVAEDLGTLHLRGAKAARRVAALEATEPEVDGQIGGAG